MHTNLQQNLILRIIQNESNNIKNCWYIKDKRINISTFIDFDLEENNFFVAHCT